jgi:hypothetical protein
LGHAYGVVPSRPSTESETPPRGSLEYEGVTRQRRPI